LSTQHDDELNAPGGGTVTDLTGQGTEEKIVEIDDLSEQYRRILEGVGEDPSREGLLKTPARAAAAMKFLTQGYRQDLQVLLNNAIFEEDNNNMVVLRDIEFYSMCVPSKQLVNAVDGAKPARDVQAGDRLWTLHEGRVVPTTVTEVSSHQVRNLVEVETDSGQFRVTADHPLATPQGWKPKTFRGCKSSGRNPTVCVAIATCRSETTALVT
jgi:GTP cyclohydrolase I